jgi:hypothetical protein
MTKVADWLGAAERKLDEHGKPAWIAAMIAGFILIWPVGLAILGYMIWSGRMGWSCNGHPRRRMAHAGASTGNAAFDEYRAETLRRLEEEQAAFTDFLDQLRQAKDKAEFDQFMASRRSGDAPSVA